MPRHSISRACSTKSESPNRLQVFVWSHFLTQNRCPLLLKVLWIWSHFLTQNRFPLLLKAL